MFIKNEADKGVELIYDVGGTDKIDNVSIGIMQNNDIPGLFPIDIITNDKNIEFKYKVGFIKNINEYLCEELTEEDLLGIFENICKAISCIEEYMLGESQIILENEYIFVEDEGIRMILLPIQNRRNSISISAFFKNLLLDMMVKNDKAAYFAADITKQLSDEEDFSYDKFLHLLSELKYKNHIEKPSVKKVELKSDLKERKVNNIEGIVKPMSSAPAYPQYNIKQQEIKSMITPGIDNAIRNINGNQVKEEKKSIFGFANLSKKKEIENSNQTSNSFLIPGRDDPINVGAKTTKEKKKFSLFGKKKENSAVENNIKANDLNSSGFAETTVLQNFSKMGETTLLGLQKSIINSFLIWKRTGERIVIDKSDFRIGREKNYVDFCINDNTSVGRNHAEIIRKDGAFFIRDLKSLNFTMVNGEKISPSLEVELWDNDIISLANEEFEFHIG